VVVPLEQVLGQPVCTRVCAQLVKGGLAGSATRHDMKGLACSLHNTIRACFAAVPYPAHGHC
jgi:hypothetical protein